LEGIISDLFSTLLSSLGRLLSRLNLLDIGLFIVSISELSPFPHILQFLSR